MKVPLCILSVLLIACWNREVESGGCALSVQRDIVSEQLKPTSGSCAGSNVYVTIANEYRAECIGGSSHCESTHYAYHSGSHYENYRHCLPRPNSDGNYYVVKHTNFPITCGSVSTTIDFHYVNATKCSCRVIINDYEITI